jgi:hypothetical protein
MKKRLLIVYLVSIITIFLVGCGEDNIVIVDAENKETLSGTTFGADALIKIGNCLWYDSSTRIVYWWNEHLGDDANSAWRCDTTPSPYYAPNGLPYRYNPETNTFEEIVK